MRAARLMTPLLLLAALFGLPAAHADVTPLDHIAVVVDDSVIMESEVDERMADVKAKFAESQQQQLPPDDVLHGQVVNQLILETLQYNLAQRAGVKIDDASLNAALTDIAGQNKQSLAQFQEQLDKGSPGAYAAVREQIRHEMMIRRLRQRVMQDRIHISDQDVQNFLKSPQGHATLAAEYRLGHILVSLPDMATPEQIAAGRAKADAAVAELNAGHDFAQVAARYSNAENALTGGDIGWRKQAELPTLFSDSVDKMKVGDVAGPLRTPGGFHIIKLLDKRGDSMTEVQYKVRHILIKPSEILSSEEAHQEITELRAKIMKGADFGEQARVHSDDPGSARNGGDLGWVPKGEMVPEFDAVMLASKPGEISEPFQSNFGWHILQVEDIRKQDMSQQFREGQAREALFERQYDEELNSWLRELRGSAYIDIKDDKKPAS